MAPGDFIAKWRAVELKERSASQSPLQRLVPDAWRANPD